MEGRLKEREMRARRRHRSERKRISSGKSRGKREKGDKTKATAVDWKNSMETKTARRKAYSETAHTAKSQKSPTSN